MLAQEEQFTPASLFYRLDSARKGHITERDFDSFLREQNVNMKGCEIKMLFGRINQIKSEDSIRVREYFL